MHRTSTGLALAALSITVALAGCAGKQPTAPARTGFLSTYRNLEATSPTSFSYRTPNNRLARYNKFIVDPVELRMPPGAKGWDETAGDLERVKNYMRQGLIDALTAGGNQVVETPAGDVAQIRVALTDAYDRGGRVQISIEAEMVDSVSDVQIGALVESRRGRNFTINDFWRTSEAKTLMNGWAKRLRDFVDSADRGSGEA